MDVFPVGWRDFLVKEISEPVEHTLRVVLSEATVSRDAVQISDLGRSAYPLDHTNNSRFIQVVWTKCISYSVLNESFTSVGPSKDASGKYISMLEIIDPSDYIEYLKKISFADQVFPGPFSHYRLFTLTHNIDVVSLCPPVFSEVGSHEINPVVITTQQLQARP